MMFEVFYEKQNNTYMHVCMPDVLVKCMHL